MPDITPGTPRNQDPSKVWISREEYEQLQAMEASGNASRAFVAPDRPYVSNIEDHSGSDKMFKQQKIIGFILAVALLIVLSIGNAGWLAVCIIGVFFIFAIMSFSDYARQRRRESSLLSDEEIAKAPPIVIRRALLAVAIVIAIPILGYLALMVLFLMILAAFGGGSAGT